MEEMRERLQAYSQGFTSYDDAVTRRMIEKITVLDAETVRVRIRDTDVELDEKL